VGVGFGTEIVELTGVEHYHAGTVVESERGSI